MSRAVARHRTDVRAVVDVVLSAAEPRSAADHAAPSRAREGTRHTVAGRGARLHARARTLQPSRGAGAPAAVLQDAQNAGRDVLPQRAGAGASAATHKG